MLMQITAHELRKALADIEAAEKNGFMFCEAVFVGGSVDPSRNLYLAYSDMIEKADPTNGALNWGRCQRVTQRFTFEDGVLVPIREKPKPRARKTSKRGSTTRRARKA